MTRAPMTSMQRVLTTLGHQEPDRVPLFLLVTMHGAKELGLTIEEYFARAEHVAEGQIRLRDKYRHDCLYAFFYAPIEIEAWGGEVIYSAEGPPNAGEPFIRRVEDIPALTPPRVSESPRLQEVLRAIELLKARSRDEVPIIGVAMSPFSIPVMQLGFDRYLDVMLERKDLLAHLLRVNEEFCVEWANAQIAAGATAICYFDPVSSPMIIPKELFLETGHVVATRTLPRLAGPAAVHLASGSSLPILDHVAQSGAAVIGVSSSESLAELKAAAAGKITLLGNLNGLEMRRWTPAQAESEVKRAIAQAGRGGGFILSDNHGEIPWQVPDEVLLAISEAAGRWGRYPLDWIDEAGE